MHWADFSVFPRKPSNPNQRRGRVCSIYVKLSVTTIYLALIHWSSTHVPMLESLCYPTLGPVFVTLSTLLLSLFVVDRATAVWTSMQRWNRNGSQLQRKDAIHFE